MTLYHVCYGHTEILKLFIPRVPESVGLTEDTVHKRICVADTIDHAFSALCDLPYTTFDKKHVTIYSIDLPEEQVISPEYLFYNHMVEDALYTREHWILFPVTMTGTRAYLRNFNSDSYFVPDEDKREEFWKALEKRVEASALAPYNNTSMDDMIRKVIPSKWNEWHVDECDICEEIGLSSMRVMYDAEILYE